MQMMKRLVLSGVIMVAMAATPAYAQALAIDLDLSSDSNLPNDNGLPFDLFASPVVAVAPPSLPIYAVPPPPAEELVWQPGYWRWDGYGYFWVPGTWVEAPIAGLLWTPGYWDWNGYAYQWHEGYWAESVGYYGGIYYGGGYDGNRFYGGSWVRGHYEHNPSIWTVREARPNYISFSGGPGGIVARASAQQLLAERERHYELTEEQRRHTLGAANNPQFRTSSNHGKPPVAATLRGGDFGHGVAADQAGPVNAQAKAYNLTVRQNPGLAEGAALPRSRTVQPAQQAVQPQQVRSVQQPVQQPQVRAVQPPSPAPVVIRLNQPQQTQHVEPAPQIERAPQVERAPSATEMEHQAHEQNVQSTRIGKVPSMPTAVHEPAAQEQHKEEPKHEEQHHEDKEPQKHDRPGEENR